MKKRLVLIDGHAVVYRAYYAFPPSLKTKKGEQANAVFGFLSILLSVVKELKPSHIAVAFDMGKPTFRHLEFTGYKAQRPETDQELKDQIGLVKESVEVLNMPIFGVDGFEADDVIGTLAKQSYDKKIEAMIVTGDQDAMQLVNGNVKVYVPARGRFPAKIYGEREVVERYGFKPKQMIDYKALCGDPSDNIPGIRGIGPKTAVELINKFGSVEALYSFSGLKRKGSELALRDRSDVTSELEVRNRTDLNNTAINSEHWKTLSAGVQKKLIDGYEDVVRSKMLATIVLDVPITLKLKDCELHDYDKSKAMTFLEELGFYSIIKRLPTLHSRQRNGQTQGKVDEILDEDKEDKKGEPTLTRRGRQVSLF